MTLGAVWSCYEKSSRACMMFLEKFHEINSKPTKCSLGEEMRRCIDAGYQRDLAVLCREPGPLWYVLLFHVAARGTLVGNKQQAVPDGLVLRGSWDDRMA